MTWDKEECEKRLPYMMEIAKGNKLLKTTGMYTRITEENKKDIEDIKEIYVKGLTFVYVKTIQDVVKHIF